MGFTTALWTFESCFFIVTLSKKNTFEKYQILNTLSSTESVLALGQRCQIQELKKMMDVEVLSSKFFGNFSEVPILLRSSSENSSQQYQKHFRKVLKTLLKSTENTQH